MEGREGRTLDPTILVAIIALIGTILTVVGSVVVAIFSTRKSSQAAAESSLEKALRERILLRDEQIADLEKEVANYKASEIEAGKEKIKLLVIIDDLKRENRVLKRMIQQLRKEKTSESEQRHRK